MIKVRAPWRDPAAGRLPRLALGVALWTVLGAALWSQDNAPRAPGRPLICAHADRGEARPLSLEDVDRLYQDLSQAFEASARRALEVPTPELLLRGFDARLPRCAGRPRRIVKLVHPVPESVVGVELVVGELEDLARARPNPGRGAYLLVRADAAQLLTALESFDGRVGLATPELVRFVGIDCHPVRVTFKDPQHVSIDPLD